MLPSEPFATAAALAIIGTLLVVSVLSSRATERLGVPVLLVFLAIGMLAGSEGIGRIPFEDYGLAYRLGTIALVFIIFDGGFTTPLTAVRQVAAPAGILATLGVIGTAATLAGLSYLAGLSAPVALLVGAVVSSTDAAAVFAVLRGSGIHLQRRVAATLEVESGANDPMAVILTTVVTANLLEGATGVRWSIVPMILIQIAVGAVFGLAIGYGGRLLLTRTRVTAAGLLVVLLIGVVALAFAVPTLLQGSGFLSVYVAGIVLGNARLPYQTGLQHLLHGVAWLSQVTMFVMLGLLVFPSRLIEIAPVGLLIALLLTFVARPLVVWLCLLPFKYPPREVVYIGWVGLRGAVPIVLGTFPVLAGARGADQIFDIVFFIVVVGAIIPGATVSWFARLFKLEAAEPPPPPAVLQIESMQPLNGELLSFYVDEALPVAGVPLEQVPVPDGAAITLIVRGREVLAPRPHVVIQPGDHVYVFTRLEDRPMVQLMFGRPEA